jgi:hypothetical protein
MNLYKISKYIGFTILFIIFITSTFWLWLLSQYSTTIADIKTNFIDLIPPEIYFVLNWFLFVFIIFLIRNF